MTRPTPEHPWMVSIPVSPYCELARWTLDRLGIAYVEEAHAPVFRIWPARRHGGGGVVPVLDTGEGSLNDAREVVEYYDARAPEPLRLFPSDPEERAEAKRLFDDLFDGLGVAVRAWAYAYMLPRRASTVRVWLVGAPRLEQRLVRVAYPVIAALVRRQLRLRRDTVRTQRALIDASLGRIAERLRDGRRYLLGDRLTAPDVAFSALVAPAVMPEGYGGPLPTLDELPERMARDVDEICASAAGAFAQRLYRDERPQRA